MAEEDITREEMHRENKARFSAVDHRISNMEKKMSLLEKNLADHKKVTEEIKSDTGELVELFKNAKAGARLIIFTGKLAKYIGYFIAAAGLVYSAYLAFKEAVLAHLH